MKIDGRMIWNIEWIGKGGTMVVAVRVGKEEVEQNSVMTTRMTMTGRTIMRMKQLPLLLLVAAVVGAADYYRNVSMLPTFKSRDWKRTC